MRKVSLVIAALALVLGIAQCKKQENSVMNGEKQHIVLNASFGDSNAKIDQEGAGLKWTVGDIINVMQGTEKLGELECKNINGTFEGTITTPTGTITFTFGEQKIFDQSGELNGAIYLESGGKLANAEGEYDVWMNMPYAVLKLNVSAFVGGTTAKDGEMALEIKVGETPVASVADVSKLPADAVYVALEPTDEAKEYTIICNGKQSVSSWPALEANTFYTKSDGNGGSTGAAIVVAPDAPIVLPTTELCFTAEDENSSVTCPLDWNSEYFLSSAPGAGWQQNTGTIYLNPGDKVYFRGDNPDGLNREGVHNCFSMDGKIAASGNIMSLISKDCSVTEIPNDLCFTNLFWACGSLTTAPELPAVVLKPGCYDAMFEGCTSLKTAPALPAEELAGSCYCQMFQNCSSLEIAPVLPARTLAGNCYQRMFAGCTSLKTAPALPATELAVHCYYTMFLGCSSLEIAPVLPATTLVDWCYEQMFSGCINLRSITMLATDVYDGEDSLNGFAEGVAEGGTFYYSSGLDPDFVYDLKNEPSVGNFSTWNFEPYEGDPK